MEQGENTDKDTNSPPLQSSPQQEEKESDGKAAASSSKIDILLKPAGDAPILKRKKWTVDKNKKISWVNNFLKKYIKCDPAESLFLYVNQSFSPSPDTDVGSIYDCFESDGKLVLHYCKTQAWG